MPLRVLIQTNAFQGYTKGQEVDLPCDEHGTALDAVWRGRINDALYKTRASKTPGLKVLEPETTPKSRAPAKVEVEE